MDRRRGQLTFFFVHAYGFVLAILAAALHLGAAAYHWRKSRSL